MRSVLIWSLLASSALAAHAAPRSAWVTPPPGYAYAAPAACPELARRQTLYRVCDDQMALFNDALSAARSEGKLLLVTFGATWCASCKSLKSELETQASGAADLTRRFTRVDIALSTLQDGRRVTVPSGEAVLRLVLAATLGATQRSVPFMAVIDPTDAGHTIARNLDDTEAPSGGIDGARFAEILTQAETAIRTGAPAPAEPGWLARKLRRWFAI